MPNTVTAWPMREITETSFTDITTTAVTSIEWDGQNDMTVTFAADLTDNEHYKARRRVRTTAEEEAREVQAVTAYSNITNWNAITSPTNAQVVAQVRALGNVVKGLIEYQFQDAARDLGVW